MSKIHIITDSASDISVESEQELNIRVLPFPVILGGDSYISRIDFDNQGFYELMDRYPDEIPKTSQITPYEFETIYQEEYDAGYTDIVLVLINSGGSATCNNAKMSIDSFFDEHPEYKDRFNIYVYDSANYSGAYGYPVMVAAGMAKEQRDISEITAYLDKEIPRRRIYFGIYALKYAGKSGRIPSAAALIGDKLNIKPVMRIFDHEITTAVKCRGENKLINKIIEETVKDMEPGSEYEVVYGNDTECRDVLIQKMTETVGYPPVCSFQVGAAVAANSGPKVVGTIFNIK